MKLRQTLLIILLATIATATAKNMIIKEYTTENGLLHNTVYSVMKDADGFVWFGTWYGLTSFDAVKFKPYNTRGDYNTDIPPHKLQNLYEAPDGNLWVKTIDHKLFLFDKKNELFFDVFNVIRKKYSVSSKIIKIQPSESGNLLMLTKNKDLLQGRSTGNGEMEVELLYDSKSTRENKLINNLLVENQQYINWIGNRLQDYLGSEREKPAGQTGRLPVAATGTQKPAGLYRGAQRPPPPVARHPRRNDLFGGCTKRESETLGTIQRQRNHRKCD